MQYRTTELTAALDCLVSYGGAIALQQPRYTFDEWIKRHYVLHGRQLTSARFELLFDLKPLVVDVSTAEADLEKVVARLELQGWRRDYLQREIDDR